MALNPAADPSGNFDLSNWKITLPVDQSGTIIGTAQEIKSLSGYQDLNYFYTGSDGAMVFRAAVDGATTSGSKYARSELREMIGADRAAWTIKQGGSMSATLEVDQVPTRFDGSAGRIVVGQIHGQDAELTRLYWDNGTVYFVNDHAGSTGQEAAFRLTNSAGKTPDISLNEKFSYKIDASSDQLKVSVYADGQVYTATDTINSFWNTDTFYFKAGTYLGVNETQGTGHGQTSFYALSFKHSGTASQPTSVPKTIKSVIGTSSSNKLTGSSFADKIDGKSGNDILWGKGGKDILVGGPGKDAFTFDVRPTSKNIDVILDFNVRNDTIRLNDQAFTKLKHGKLSSSSFVIGDKALDSKDQIIYNNKTGALLYDADGSGRGAAVKFATIDDRLKITAADFVVI
jgi:Ca2+-binding RTX toxin-like protein